MPTQFVRLLYALSLCCLCAIPAFAAELAEQLSRPDYVLIMRHARAPGVGDPDNFTLKDCATQRNLNEEGRQQARRIGHWLREQGVQNARVASSPWCRTRETAQLLGFGAPQPEDSLASFFSDASQASSANERLQAYLRTTLPHKQGAALILVTHDVNIARWTGESLASGEMVLVRVDASGKPLAQQVIARPN
ncbi:histidine phosphatase family protein [Herbaspirillum seropedicae]|uniref:histidine phosphatase family protein n=1 Tax=Herbaspirillum seropedicae TaxID=964 RepID=UPI003D990BDA